MTTPHALQLAGLVASCLIFGALMYRVSNRDTRSPSALALASRCVDEAHKQGTDQGTTPHIDPALAVACARYFRLRSDAEAAADEQRWQDNHRRSGGAGSP